MSEDDIDLDRVVNDPKYRRQVLDYLNAKEADAAPDNVVRLHPDADSIASASVEPGDTDPSQD